METTPLNSKYKALNEHVIKVYGGNEEMFTHILKLLLDGMSVNIN